MKRMKKGVNGGKGGGKKEGVKMLLPGIEFIAFEVLDGYYATLRNDTSHCLVVENHIYIFDVCGRVGGTRYSLWNNSLIAHF